MLYVLWLTRSCACIFLRGRPGNIPVNRHFTTTNPNFVYANLIICLIGHSWSAVTEYYITYFMSCLYSLCPPISLHQSLILSSLIDSNSIHPSTFSFSTIDWFLCLCTIFGETWLYSWHSVGFTGNNRVYMKQNSYILVTSVHWPSKGQYTEVPRM